MCVCVHVSVWVRVLVLTSVWRGDSPAGVLGGQARCGCVYVCTYLCGCGCLRLWRGDSPAGVLGGQASCGCGCGCGFVCMCARGCVGVHVCAYVGGWVCIPVHIWVCDVLCTNVIRSTNLKVMRTVGILLARYICEWLSFVCVWVCGCVCFCTHIIREWLPFVCVWVCLFLYTCH